MDSLSALRSWAIPDHDQRNVVSLYTWPQLLLPMLPLLLIIHLLLRYPGSRPLRLSLLPLAILASLRAGYGIYWDHPRAQHFNFALGIYAIFGCMRSLEWSSMKEAPRLRTWPSSASEDAKGKPVQASGKEAAVVGVHGNGSAAAAPTTEAGEGKKTTKEPLPNFLPGTLIPLEIELLTSMRGVGWAWGIRGPSPSEAAEMDAPDGRRAWIWHRVKVALTCEVLLDVLDTLIKSKWMPLGQVGGASVYDLDMLPFGLGAPLSTFALGFTVFAVMQGHQALLSLLAVLVFRDRPSQWSPLLFGTPHLATSLSDFWGKHWHALFRRSFLFLAYAPASKLVRPVLGRTAARAAGVLAVFALSGLMHDLGQLNMGGGLDLKRMTGFFVLQGVGCLLEETFENFTGRKVRGLLGWVWTMGWLLTTGTQAADVWFSRGLGAGYATPRFTGHLLGALGFDGFAP